MAPKYLDSPSQETPASDQARARWIEAGELDQITVIELRMWDINRALDALTGTSGVTAAGAAALRERDMLTEWLHCNGYVALAATD
ncbi:hypothetical protein [Streptomyces xanthochromogenes]|uniref:hypothetical protein n=1 Tax=Streptomyces xanthochromogenes TaxID=67384 RepID=UPI0037FF5F92